MLTQHRLKSSKACHNSHPLGCKPGALEYSANLCSNAKSETL
jgi:hypothetical protein